ncbi:hypothetical protein D9757_014051 [Collybiopsis confluens]|uniref:F-box protein n=1 Tax=Collybiopsis confluens TaxID=2823264 RepID=A0A8H5FRL2_9AGAR|nr:hypothetical protein D9757_014051 [Collybiopsis confluens]
MSSERSHPILILQSISSISFSPQVVLHSYFLIFLGAKLRINSQSKSLHYHLFTLLYRDIQIRDLQSSLKLVQFLLANPQIARSVISITLRPNYLLKANGERLAGEKELAHAVELLAPNLYQLQRFVWDGIENAPSKMWANLRAGCPQLKHIGTNIGNQLLDPDSELFAFSDLHSFLLTTELHYRDSGSLYTLHGEELPPAMWAMLIGRCPNLECLVLGDSGMMRMRSKRKLSIRPLLQARWPKLDSLRISNASILYEDDIFSGLPKIQFINFLNFHGHSLRELKYHDLSGASTRAGYAEPPPSGKGPLSPECLGDCHVYSKRS